MRSCYANVRCAKSTYAEEVPLQWFRVAKYNYCTRAPLENIENDVKSDARKAARASLPSITSPLLFIILAGM